MSGITTVILHYIIYVGHNTRYFTLYNIKGIIPVILHYIIYKGHNTYYFTLSNISSIMIDNV